MAWRFLKWTMKTIWYKISCCVTAPPDSGWSNCAPCSLASVNCALSERVRVCDDLCNYFALFSPKSHRPFCQQRRVHHLSYDPGVFLNSLTDFSSVLTSVSRVNLNMLSSHLVFLVFTSYLGKQKKYEHMDPIHWANKAMCSVKSCLLFLICNPLWVCVTSASVSFEDEDEEGRQFITSGGTVFLALNQTLALLVAGLLGASLLGALFLLGTNPGAGAGDQGGYGGYGGSGGGSYSGGGGYGQHKTKREATWGKWWRNGYKIIWQAQWL